MHYFMELNSLGRAHLAYKTMEGRWVCAGIHSTRTHHSPPLQDNNDDNDDMSLPIYFGYPTPPI